MSIASFLVEGLQVVASIQSPPPPTCGQFPASFLAVIDQNIDAPDFFIVADPELTFFKQVLNFRDIEESKTFDNAIKFFNESYGLDFSLSPPTDQNEYFYQNAKMGQFRLAEEVDNVVTLNNWIQTGNTRSTCYRIRDRGFQVKFSDDQVVHGSYALDITYNNILEQCRKVYIVNVVETWLKRMNMLVFS